MSFGQLPVDLSEGALEGAKIAKANLKRRNSSDTELTVLQEFERPLDANSGSGSFGGLVSCVSQLSQGARTLGFRDARAA
jgi:hypothetical protein